MRDYVPMSDTERRLHRELQQFGQVIAVLVARQGGEVHLTDADRDDVMDGAYGMEILEDPKYMRTTLKAWRRDEV